MAREEQRQRAAQRFAEARAALDAAVRRDAARPLGAPRGQDVAAAAACARHAAEVVRAEADMEARRRDFYTGG